ncbi:Nse4 C-terminal-domain-containing protein [Podospora aff. communis PSN243]|uniref:Non-structural maintenance of chromosomes element 4 n=1 Tax=Podospora aff. communis PSN243 TaxID=3040156 RepID=A0AAV9GXU7_9PEZI|nr:Nse4 C-terminal-domain-containing protein [Podospora aff. communis PSN243]
MADSDLDPSSPRNHRNLAVRHRENGIGSRKRQQDEAGESSSTRRRTREPSPEDDAPDRDAYDPDQSMQERRQIQRTLRGLQQEMRENPDEFLQADPTALLTYLTKSDSVMKNVKQTVEAAIDSRGLVIAADLSARRVARLTSGTAANGVDVDEFVSKCISYMRHGGGIEDDNAQELSSTQRRRRQPNHDAMGPDDEDEVGDDGDMENWAHLGRFAIIPNIRRPALPGFLMGPLSIEKKARKTAVRSAPFKVSTLREVRPEALRVEDLKKSDKNDLAGICRRIHELLVKVQADAQESAEHECTELYNEGLPEEEQDRREAEIMERHGLRQTGGICLLRFVVNPKSFGQTVENLFYVSFLIRDRHIMLQFDDMGRPSIAPTPEEMKNGTTQTKHAPQRHQSIMSLDMDIWRDIIDAFSIEKSMIPHRQEEDNSGPGARGWYS